MILLKKTVLLSNLHDNSHVIQYNNPGIKIVRFMYTGIYYSSREVFLIHSKLKNLITFFGYSEDLIIIAVNFHRYPFLNWLSDPNSY